MLICLDGLPSTALAGSPSDPWVEGGLRFTHARSTSTDPVLSHASMLSSRFPSEIAPLDRFFVPPDLMTAPKVLSRRGYATAGFYGDDRLAPNRGFGAGFDRYMREPHCGALKHIVPEAERWVRETRAVHEGPLFLWIEACDGAIDDARGAQRRQAHAHEADIALEAPLRALLQRLEAAGLGRSHTTFLLVSAGAHPTVTNARALERGTHVPMWVWGAGVQGGREVSTPVSLIDLLPTVLALTETHVGGEMRGQSLHEGLRADATIRALPAVAEGSSWALIVAPEGGALCVSGAAAGSRRICEILARETDPRIETKGRVSDPARLRIDLLQVETLGTALTDPSPRAITPALRDTLRDHGYW